MWGSGLFASFQICLQSLVARSPFCVLIMIHVLWSHSVNWVVRDCQKRFRGLVLGGGGCGVHVRLVDLSSSGIMWLFPKTSEVRISSFPLCTHSLPVHIFHIWIIRKRREDCLLKGTLNLFLFPHRQGKSPSVPSHGHITEEQQGLC